MAWSPLQRVALVLTLILVAANILGAYKLDLSSFPPSSRSSEYKNDLPSKQTTKVSPPTMLQKKRRFKHRVYFVHVGKTGGETLRQILRYSCRLRANPTHRRACLQFFQQHKETELSRYTLGIMHANLQKPKQGMARATTFLWTLRNPIERVISSYRYMHPGNCGGDLEAMACLVKRSIALNKNPWARDFFTCFPVMEDFAQGLFFSKQPSKDLRSNLTGADTSLSINKLGVNCSQLAWNTILGMVPASGHLYYNHQYYWNQTLEQYPDKQVWVVRTEFLWTDLQRIEQQGFNDTMNPNLPALVQDVKHGSESHQRKGTLSDAGRRFLCCALVKELIIYGRLLEAATNLDPSAKNQSMSIVLQQCGSDSIDHLKNTLCN
jgi:hypothetical protein